MSMIAVSVFTACSKDDNKETPVTITDVTPTEVAVGDEITITGTGLDRVVAVRFGTVEALKANFVSSSATTIKVNVPAGVTFPAEVAVVAAIGATPIPWAGGSLTANEATQAQVDAFAFLLCANNAFTAYPDEASAEYRQAVGACLQNNLTVASLSFNAQGQPNNEYTTALFAAITETVTTMYVGQTPDAIAASIAGIHGMIYYFYLSLQSAL